MNFKHDPLSAEAQLDIIRALRTLDRRSRRAVLLRLRGCTLRAVGCELEVTHERARQVIQRGVEKMTRFLTRAPAKGVGVGAVDGALARAHREAARAHVVRARPAKPAQPERIQYERVFCDYVFCPTPRQPIRSGRKHQYCRTDSTRRARERQRLEQRAAEAS